MKRKLGESRIDRIGLDDRRAVGAGMIDGARQKLAHQPVAPQAARDIETDERPDDLAGLRRRAAQGSMGLAWRDRHPADRLLAPVSQQPDRRPGADALHHHALAVGRRLQLGLGGVTPPDHAPAVLRRAGASEEVLEGVDSWRR